MASELELYIDIRNGNLVNGLNDQAFFQFGKIFQGSLIPLRIFLVQPIEGATTQPFFQKVDISNITIRVAVGPIAGASALLAYQDVWSKQTTTDAQGKSGYFYASLNLNTPELNTAIGSATTYGTNFEVQISENGAAWRPVSQNALTILGTVWDASGAGSLPSPADSYPTWIQANATYLKKVNADGDVLVIQIGSYEVELRPNADGSVSLNAVPV